LNNLSHLESPDPSSPYIYHYELAFFPSLAKQPPMNMLTTCRAIQDSISDILLR
jgi:hypothetical protein